MVMHMITANRSLSRARVLVVFMKCKYNSPIISDKRSGLTMTKNTLSWTGPVGPIPDNDGQGKEIITRFESDLKTNGVFYTDANGRQTIRRHFDNNRKGCTNNVITGNWYPVYTRIQVKDEKKVWK